jgi:lipopolysaccharide heptosyltransferase II
MNPEKSPRRTQPGRILVVRNDRVGDLVLTLPAIELLKRSFPDAHLTVLVSQYAGPLVAAHPAIDELIYDDAAHSAWQLGRRLRKHRFDTVLVINTSTRNCLAVRLARIRRRVCWAYKPIGWLASTHPVKLHRSRPPIHESEFALAFAGQLGVPLPASRPIPQLPIDAAVRTRVGERITRELGNEGPLFGVHPGNKNSAYNWPPSHYAQLVGRLAEHARVMLTGGPDERALLETVSHTVAAANRHRVGIYCDLSLPELAAGIALQSALIVSSTGPMHVAGVVGTPTVALFSPHPAHVPAKWAPLGTRHTLLVAPLAAGEAADVPRERGTELMARIAVDDVVAAALAHTATRATNQTRAA